MSMHVISFFHLTLSHSLETAVLWNNKAPPTPTPLSGILQSILEQFNHCQAVTRAIVPHENEPVKQVTSSSLNDPASSGQQRLKIKICPHLQQKLTLQMTHYLLFIIFLKALLLWGDKASEASGRLAKIKGLHKGRVGKWVYLTDNH